MQQKRKTKNNNLNVNLKNHVKKTTRNSSGFLLVGLVARGCAWQ